MADTRRGTKEFTSHPLQLTFCPHHQFPQLELLSSRDNTHPKQPNYFLLLYWFYNPPVLLHLPKHDEELFGINRCAASSSPGMAGQGRRCGIGLSFALSLSLYVNFALNFALKPSIALVITLIMIARSNYSQKHLTRHFCPCEGVRARPDVPLFEQSTEPHLLCLSLVFCEEISASLIQLPSVQSLMNGSWVTAYG